MIENALGRVGLKNQTKKSLNNGYKFLYNLKNIQQVVVLSIMLFMMYPKLSNAQSSIQCDKLDMHTINADIDSMFFDEKTLTLGSSDFYEHFNKIYISKLIKELPQDSFVYYTNMGFAYELAKATGRRRNMDKDLTDIAQKQADYLSRTGKNGHHDGSGRYFWERFKNQMPERKNIVAGGENLLSGDNASIDLIILLWLGSMEHRPTIMRGILSTPSNEVIPNLFGLGISYANPNNPRIVLVTAMQTD